MVRALRDSGVSIADVVRVALRARARAARKRASLDTDALLEEMAARYPRKGPTTPRPKSTDRQAVRRAIRAKLRSATS
jgi:hypothetical protein